MTNDVLAMPDGPGSTPTGQAAARLVGSAGTIPIAESETTFALEISFGGVGVHISREAHSRIVDAVSLICDEYEQRHPDRIMWPAGFGAKMMVHPLALSDDDPIPFDESVEVIQCCERERFDDEREHPYCDPIDEMRVALLDHNDLLRSAYQVAKRAGQDTNWEALTARLLEVLQTHHRTVNRTRHASAIEARSDATAKTGAAEGESAAPKGDAQPLSAPSTKEGN